MPRCREPRSARSRSRQTRTGRSAAAGVFADTRRRASAWPVRVFARVGIEAEVKLEASLPAPTSPLMANPEEVTVYVGGARLDDEAQVSSLLRAVKAGAHVRQLLAAREPRVAMSFDPHTEVGCYVVTDGRYVHAFSAESITEPQAAEVWLGFEDELPRSASDFANLVAKVIGGEVRTIH